MKKFRKWNRILHRDFGFFIAGLTLIYAVSGIALNHKEDWEPNFVIKKYEILANIPKERDKVTEQHILELLEKFDKVDNYKKYIFINDEKLKVYLTNGSMTVNIPTGKGFMEIKKRRPLFYQINTLHYVPNNWWKYFSDFYAFLLIMVTITGLIIVRGKKGFLGRGGIYFIIGFVIPIIFLLILKI